MLQPRNKGPRPQIMRPETLSFAKLLAIYERHTQEGLFSRKATECRDKTGGVGA